MSFWDTNKNLGLHAPDYNCMTINICAHVPKIRDEWKNLRTSIFYFRVEHPRARTLYIEFNVAYKSPFSRYTIFRDACPKLRTLVPRFHVAWKNLFSIYPSFHVAWKSLFSCIPKKKDARNTLIIYKAILGHVSI